MKERKKAEADDMLVVHKVVAADPDKAGRERGPGDEARRDVSLDREEFELMKKRFAAAKDPGERRRILAEVQRRFGNAKAALLVKEARGEGDDLPSEGPGKKRQ